MTCNISSATFCNPYYPIEQIRFFSAETCEFSFENPFDESSPIQSREDSIVTCYNVDGNRVAGDSLNYLLQFVIDLYYNFIGQNKSTEYPLDHRTGALNAEELNSQTVLQFEEIFVIGDVSWQAPLEFQELKINQDILTEDLDHIEPICQDCTIDILETSSAVLSTASNMITAVQACDRTECESLFYNQIDNFFQKFKEPSLIGKLKIKCCYGSKINLAESPFSSKKMNPYVKLRLGSGIWNSCVVYKTTANLLGGKSPVWNEDFIFDIYDSDEFLEFSIWHDDEISDSQLFLGGNIISLENWVKGKEKYERWYRKAAKSIKGLKRPDSIPIYTYNLGNFEGDLPIYGRNRNTSFRESFALDGCVKMCNGPPKRASELKINDIYISNKSRPRKVNLVRIKSSKVTVLSVSGETDFPDIDESLVVGKCYLKVRYDPVKPPIEDDSEIILAKQIEEEKRELLLIRNPGLVLEYVNKLSK